MKSKSDWLNVKTIFLSILFLLFLSAMARFVIRDTKDTKDTKDIGNTEYFEGEEKKDISNISDVSDVSDIDTKMATTRIITAEDYMKQNASDAENMYVATSSALPAPAPRATSPKTHPASEVATDIQNMNRHIQNTINAHREDGEYGRYDYNYHHANVRKFFG